MSTIEVGNMVFLAEGNEGIGAVRALKGDGFTLYVENGGEFLIPHSAVLKVHDGKVLIDPAAVAPRLKAALRHTHDAEDPKLVG